MPNWLKQSTSVDVGIGPFLDETDGKTAETGLTITQPDIRLKKNGGAWAQKNAAQTLSHEEAGWYEVTLDATDTNTLGILIVAVHESGALPVWKEYMVVPAMIYDSIVAGSDRLDTNVTHVGDTAQTAGDIIADTNDIQTRLPAALVSGRIDASVGAMAANVMTAAAAAADLTTELQSGLATAAALDAVDNFVDTEITAIKTVVDAIQLKTDNLPSDPADASVVAGLIAAVDAKVDTIDNVVNSILVDTAEIGAAGAGLTALASQASVTTIDDLLDTEVAAIKTVVDAVKLKTDNLPADPATETTLATLATAANLATVDTVVDGIKAKTDSLTFTNAGVVDSNITHVISDPVQVNGADDTNWGGAP
jgi:hypothetical protein